jgi:hypothetical protein
MLQFLSTSVPTLESEVVLNQRKHNSNEDDDVIMPIVTVSTLFQKSSLISDEFWHGASCIRRVIFLAFCAYVEHPKQSPYVIWTSILI